MAGTRVPGTWHVSVVAVAESLSCARVASLLTTDIIIPAAGANLRVLHYCCCTQSAGCISTLTAVLQCCMLLTADILLLGVLPVLSSIPAATHFTYTGEGHKTKVRKVFQFYR